MRCPFCLGEDLELIQAERPVSTVSRLTPLVTCWSCNDCGQHIEESSGEVQLIGDPDLEAVSDLLHELRQGVA